jgi:cobalt-zinc-cadmium efflux system outer membrane protein
MEWNSLAASLVSMSPEYIAAQTRIAQAQANLQRHEVQAIPNLSLQVGAGKDNGTDSGMMNVQVGAPIPLFNKNQGNIAAARAEVCRAYLEAQRIEKSIQARLAHVSREYDAALAAVQQYDAEILPSAQASLELAEEAYRAGETDFLQVLVARRTYFDSNLQYLFAQAELGAAQAKLDGYLLSGGLDEVRDGSGDASLRDLTFSQQ